LEENFEQIKIMDLKLPAKGIVGVVQRRNRIIIPNGTTQIMGGDILIIFTTGENAPAIRNYFQAD
jgi:Trk K+ transport system NAD-binding subunit